MPVHVVVLAEFELEVAVALVLKPPSQGFEYLEAVEAAPEAALSEAVVAYCLRMHYCCFWHCYGRF